MLAGTLKYTDFSVSEYKGTEKQYTFEVKAAEFPDTLWLNLETNQDDFFKVIEVNKMIHRCVRPEKYNKDVTDITVGNCRIDVARTVKTNAINTVFAARVGSVVRYALSIPSRTVLNENGDLLATDKIGGNEFQVKYCCSVPTELYIKTQYIELELKKADYTEVFPKLQEKNVYGTVVSITPISNIAVKKSYDFLGFTPPKKEVDDVPEWGLRQTIEEVIAANPDKNTSWILDRHYIIVDETNCDEILEMFDKHTGLIAFDTETTGLNVTFRSAQGNGDTIVGLSLSFKAGEGYYFPLAHKKFANLSDDITYFMQTKIKPILEGHQIICHNTSFDWKVAYLYGINTNVVFDTMVAFSCTFRYEYGKTYETGLKALAKNILGLDMFDLEDFVIGDWGSTEITFADLPYELVRRYATADADMTLSLYEWLVKNDILNKYNATRVHDLEVQFAKAVGYSEYWGYRVDMERLPKMIEENAEALQLHEQEMYRLAGHEFNPNSPKQLKAIMYEELGIEKIGGQDSTKAEILKELGKMRNPDGSVRYPFVNELLAYRNAEGTHKNFIKKRDEFITPDGFIFPHIFQFGTDTGRVSIKEPNYQSYDKLVKHYIVPREGYLHFDCDFSQIEYRVLASMAQQDNLCAALADPDMDYHTYQASRMFNVPYASVSSALRSQSKGINFGLPYGMEDKSLGKRIFGKVTPENTAKAANLRKKYFQGQEKIQSFFEVVRSQGVAEGYTETWLGRRRYYDKQRFDTGSIRRQAGNHVIQGCLDGDTRIQTKELGIVKIKDVVDTHLLVWNGTKWTNGDILYSGKKRKCIVHFNNGQKFICSPIHKFLVTDKWGKEDWVECQHLKFGNDDIDSNSRVKVNRKDPYTSNDIMGVADYLLVENVEITDEYIDMYDVCNTDDGYYVADGIITHNTAADIYKMAVVEMFDMIVKNDWLGKVLINAFVHDEILVEVHDSINPYQFLKYWREAYQIKIKGFCQLYAGAGFGENWYVAKSQDLPPQFIQDCIDKADTVEWDGNIEKFLKQINDEYFDYKVRRVVTYITDKSNENQVIKPLINTLLIGVTAKAMNLKEKDVTKQFETLDEIIAKFRELYSTYFNDSMTIYKILPPDAATTSQEAKEVKVQIDPIDKQQMLVNMCLNFGVAVDVDEMKIYLLFVQNKKVLDIVKGYCNPDTGYALKFVVSKGVNDVEIMNTNYFIKGSDASGLQMMYRGLTLNGVHSSS